MSLVNTIELILEGKWSLLTAWEWIVVLLLLLGILLIALSPILYLLELVRERVNRKNVKVNETVGWIERELSVRPYVSYKNIPASSDDIRKHAVNKLLKANVISAIRESGELVYRKVDEIEGI